MLTRRSLVCLGAVAELAACAPAVNVVTAEQVGPAAYPPLPAFYGPVYDEPFPVAEIPQGTLAPEYWRQEVANPWPEYKRGTIVVDPDAALLHFVQSPTTAFRYGVSVGAEGFAWQGTARLQFKRSWPRWNVPDTMAARRPDLEPFTVANGGMDPGPGNPMGARALYLFQNGVDTLYRIHGNAVPAEVGKAVSSGCIRMLDQDVIDLHDRAVHGATVIVTKSAMPSGLVAI